MAFEISQHGTEIIISQSTDGRYSDFKAVRHEVLRKEKTLVIDKVVVLSEGIKYPIPGGLAKITNGLDWDNFFTAEVITQTKDLSQDELEYKKIADEEYEKEINKKIYDAQRTGNWDGIPPDLKERAIANVVLTTSYVVAGREIDYELDVITFECAYGMNIFRDLFASVRDIIGGRSKAVETVIRDARITAMRGLREEAINLGADAVIAVDLDYSELSGGAKNGILLAIASGTAVKLK